MPNETIDPGPGYRLLSPDEVILEGDQWQIGGDWKNEDNHFRIIGHNRTVRRERYQFPFIEYRRRVEPIQPAPATNDYQLWRAAANSPPVYSLDEALARYHIGADNIRFYAADEVVVTSPRCGRCHSLLGFQTVAFIIRHPDTQDLRAGICTACAARYRIQNPPSGYHAYTNLFEPPPAATSNHVSFPVDPDPWGEKPKPTQKPSKPSAPAFGEVGKRKLVL